MASDPVRPAPAATEHRRGSQQPLFRPMAEALLRAPLLPLEFYRELSGRAASGAEDCTSLTHERQAALEDPRVRLSLLIGSRSLFEALERDCSAPGRDSRLSSRLLRFLIRMSTRPTPYGMFAGVCLARLDRETDVALSGNMRRRIRPDMGWLIHFIAAVEGLPEVRARMRVATNPAIHLRAGRVILAERVNLSETDQAPEVSIRATGAVLRALEAAQAPTEYSGLKGQLLLVPGATPDRVDRLLSSLLQQTFLLSDLRPPLTSGDPARHVLDRLAGIEAVRPALDELRLLLEQAALWETLPPEEAIPAYRQLLGRAERLVPREIVSTPFQVDLVLSPEKARIHRAVGEEAARAAELLLRLTPFLDGPPAVAAYRRDFVSRYGFHREVPLLDLLDSHLGLGPFSRVRIDPRDNPVVARRERVLMELAAAAQRTLCPRLDLDEALLSRLQAAEIHPRQAPASLDLAVFIAARSARALDAGQFEIVVGPNVGSTAAGRFAGRFASDLGEEGVSLLRKIAALEEAVHDDVLWAELVYLPHRPRLANVSVRPGVREHEIPVGLQPGLTGADSIPLRELVVGVEGERFRLRWPRAGKEVRICSGHMLNVLQGPEVCRFLVEISHDGAPMLMPFQWGEAGSFPYLPRVQSGRVVLRPAEWKVDYSCRERFFPAGRQVDFAPELGRWRRMWAVPRHVYLTFADHRLLLDLEDASQADELRMEISRLTEGARLILQEVIPAFDDLWMKGPGGSFCGELCVSLVEARPLQRTPEVGRPVGSRPPVSPAERLLPPGSEWVYLKLYCGADLQDDLLAGPVREIDRKLLEEGLARQWFFLRYSDPDPHLRLRFRCIEAGLRPSVFSMLCGWATELMNSGRCLRFAFDTYDREIERYGGPEALVVAEEIFDVDSSSIAQYLFLLQRHREIDPHDLVVATTNNLLAGLSLDEAEVDRWLAPRRGDKTASGAEYRERRAVLRSYVAPRGIEAAPALPSMIRDAMESARERLRPLAAGLSALHARSLLSQPKERLLEHFAHMHHNRLIGADAAVERLTLALLYRTREAIAHERR